MAPNGLLWICTMALAGIILMHTGSEATETDPCDEYEDIREDSRDVSRRGSNCDKNLKPGWYRFYIDGASAIIPTSCIKPGLCGTSLGMWADLKGKPMPVEGTTIDATACASYMILEHWGCCVLQQDIKIRHCPGNFYVYSLTPTDRCPVSYCAIKNSTYVAPSETVRHGYHLRYVETTTVTELTTQQVETTTQEFEATTIQYQDDTSIRMNLLAIQQTTEETDTNETLLNTEETPQMVDMTTVPAKDEEKSLLDDMKSSGSDEFYDPGTPQVSYEVSTSSGVEKATTVRSAVIPATTRSSTIDKTHDGRATQPAELIFLLNGHDKEDVLASFRANFTAAMQRANRHIHNITVKELCPIGDAVKILFWAYDKNGKIIPGFKVQENMDMREKVEEALGLRPHTQRQDIFQEYLALFIILIIIGFLCLIILLSSCMYLYCRRHSGHWDRALAEQYHVTVVPRREARVAESPYSDEAIMSDEILEKSHSSLGSHYPGMGNLHDVSYPNSLSGIKAMNNKNSFNNTYPNSYGSLPKDGIEGLLVPIEQLKPEKDALIIEDTVL